MYQFSKSDKLKNIAIKEVILTQDRESQHNDFIFFCHQQTWYQIYVDLNVMSIIEVVEANFENYLEDLDQNILARFCFNSKKISTIDFNAENMALTIKNTECNLIFKIESDSFQSLSFKTKW